MTTTRYQVRGVAALLAVLLAFALTACAPQEDAVTTGGGASSGSSNEGPDAEGRDADGTDSDDTETSAEESDRAVLTGQACLYGNWYLDNESFHALLEAAGGDVREVTGWVVLTFNDDGTTTTTYDEWTTVVAQDGAVATMVRNGEDLGFFDVADGDAFTMTETDASSVVEMTMRVDGQDAVTVRADPEPSPLSRGTFTCEGDTLTVVADGETSILYREH